jgi:hypothetical protein
MTRSLVAAYAVNRMIGTSETADTGKPCIAKEILTRALRRAGYGVASTRCLV